MPSLKLSNLFRHDPEKPSLRERGATLRAGLARLTRRPDPEASADQGRRAVMGGALAAAVPLPALAAPDIASVAQPHPDQAVFDAEAAMLRAEQTHAAADTAQATARRMADAELGICPASILATREDLSEFNSPFGSQEVRGCRCFRWVREHEADHSHTGHAWTPEGLRLAIRLAVPLFGTGGQTPHRIRRYRALLPIAEAFDARRSEIHARYRTDELSSAYRDTGRAMSDAQQALDGMLASTPAGLAVLVRHVGSYAWRNMGGGWPALLVSAAAVSGVDLSERAERRTRTTFM